MKDSYKEIIKSFSDLDINKKHEEIINEIQETLMFFHSLCKDKDLNNEILTDETMKDLIKNDISEQEFLNGMYAYILSMKESIGEYMESYKK